MSSQDCSPQRYYLRRNDMTYFMRTLVPIRDTGLLIVSLCTISTPKIVVCTSQPLSVLSYRGCLAGTRNINPGLPTWLADYLSPVSTCTDELFSRRFGLPKQLYFLLAKEIHQSFRNRWGSLPDAARKTGINSDVKLMTFIRMVILGESSEIVYDGARMGAETLHQYFHAFCQT